MTFKTRTIISTGSNHFNNLQEYRDFINAIPAYVQVNDLHLAYKNAGKTISLTLEYDSNNSTAILTKEWDSSLSAREFNDSIEVEAVRSFQRAAGWEIVSWEVLPS